MVYMRYFEGRGALQQELMLHLRKQS